jgi:diphthine synthase
VGLGLGGKGASLEAINTMKEADSIYLEYYTSPHEPLLLKELEGSVGKNIVIVNRAFVEDGERIIEEAKRSRVVLAIQGDPMIATTHNDLRVRAIRNGIETNVIHGATIASAAASESGLHYYKFGRIITYTSDESNLHAQVYHTIHQNLLRGLHTLLLLEFDVEKQRGVYPSDATRGLLLAEANFKRGVIGDETFMLILSRIGTKNSSIRAGSVSQLSKQDFSEHPHCIIVPGSLHFTEIEAVGAIFGIKESEIRDNSLYMKRTAQVLVPKYVQKTKKALNTAKVKLEGKYEELLENVELYMKDADNFLANNEDELAMLSIGYAEGLLDSLNFTNKLKIEW